MKNRISKYPGRVKMTPVEGQKDVYDVTWADEPIEEGDPLNKQTLLTDETAALYGLGGDAVVDEVLGMIPSKIDAHIEDQFDPILVSITKGDFAIGGSGISGSKGTFPGATWAKMTPDKSKILFCSNYTVYVYNVATNAITAQLTVATAAKPTCEFAGLSNDTLIVLLYNQAVAYRITRDSITQVASTTISSPFRGVGNFLDELIPDENLILFGWRGQPNFYYYKYDRSTNSFSLLTAMGLNENISNCAFTQVKNGIVRYDYGEFGGSWGGVGSTANVVFISTSNVVTTLLSETVTSSSQWSFRVVAIPDGFALFNVTKSLLSIYKTTSGTPVLDYSIGIWSPAIVKGVGSLMYLPKSNELLFGYKSKFNIATREVTDIALSQFEFPIMGHSIGSVSLSSSFKDPRVIGYVGSENQSPKFVGYSKGFMDLFGVDIAFCQNYPSNDIPNSPGFLGYGQSFLGNGFILMNPKLSVLPGRNII